MSELERFQIPLLEHTEGTVEQLAQRLAAHALAYELGRIEDNPTGWERIYRAKALEVAQHLRRIAGELFAAGTKGLEDRAAYEIARMKGFPCPKCGHQHEGSRYSFRCFRCLCSETYARSSPAPAPGARDP